MKRSLATPVAILALAWSGTLGMLDHEHGLGRTSDDLTCVIDHSSSLERSGDESRATFEGSVDEHDHVCVGCHLSRVRTTTSIDLATEFGIPEAVAFIVREQPTFASGIQLSSVNPRGPPTG